jgi:DNA-directed RNA polymerase-3 subunit RPC5
MDIDREEEIDGDDDASDPVIKTLDVFLSQNLPGTRDTSGSSDGVFVFQHPLRPKWMAMQEGWDLDKVAYRPLNQMVELEMISGFAEDENEFRHKLVSSKITPKATYAIGLLRDDQVHLTPLQSVLQFRPRFDHKDEEDAANKKKSASSKSADNDAQVTFPEIRPLVMTFTRATKSCFFCCTLFHAHANVSLLEYMAHYYSYAAWLS